METFESYLLFIIVALPMAGATLLMLVPSYRPEVVRWVATLVALSTMLLSLYTFGFYDHEQGGFQFMRSWNWLELPGPWPLGERGITFALE